MVYCSKCGNEVKAGLNFCNRCGGRISGESKSDAERLTVAFAIIGASGFGVLVGLVAILLGNGFPTDGVIMTVIVYLATLFGISFLTLRQISQLSHASKEKAQPYPESYEAPQIGKANANQLEEPKQAPASVVEDTTRTLNKVPVERK